LNNQQKYFYIGVDLSTTNTGIVVLSNSGGLLDFKLISPENKDIKERAYIVSREVKKYIRQHRDVFTKIVIEDISLHSKGKVVDLAMLLGSVYYSLKKHYEIVLVPPTTLKKFYTKNGRAKKEDMISNTPELIIKRFSDKYKKIDDLVDAYALALYGLLN